MRPLQFELTPSDYRPIVEEVLKRRIAVGDAASYKAVQAGRDEGG